MFSPKQGLALIGSGHPIGLGGGQNPSPLLAFGKVEVPRMRGRKSFRDEGAEGSWRLPERPKGQGKGLKGMSRGGSFDQNGGGPNIGFGPGASPMLGKRGCCSSTAPKPEAIA